MVLLELLEVSDKLDFLRNGIAPTRLPFPSTRVLKVSFQMVFPLELLPAVIRANQTARTVTAFLVESKRFETLKLFGWLAFSANKFGEGANPLPPHCRVTFHTLSKSAPVPGGKFEWFHTHSLGSQ